MGSHDGITLVFIRGKYSPALTVIHFFFEQVKIITSFFLDILFLFSHTSFFKNCFTLHIISKQFY